MIRPSLGNHFALLLVSAAVLTIPGAIAGVIYEPYAIETLAGWGSNEHTVDGPANKAQFANPDGLVVDKDGNVFVAEVFGQTIRKITPDGFATTFAGKAGESGSADGRGADARFNCPVGLTITPHGVMYVADYYNNTIRKVTPRGVVSTLAGLAGAPGFVDGTGSDARFNGPQGVTVNEAGDIFVADAYNWAIRKITHDGTVTTFAGGTRGWKDGKGTDAEFDSPSDIAADKSGNLYVIENGLNLDIRKITPDAVVSTVVQTRLYRYGVAVDHNNNVFVSNGGAIAQLTSTGELIPFAGERFGSEDGIGTDAQFAWPMRLAFDRNNNLFVSDAHEFWLLWSNETIRKVTPDAVVTTFCGISDMGSRDGAGTKARMFWPRGVAAKTDGTLYVADSYNSTIRKIFPNGVVITIAGKVQSPGYVDGAAADSRFDSPATMALDASDNLLIADQGNGVIRKLTPDGQVSTLANGYDFSGPSGIAVDVSGNIYVSATYNETINKITPAGYVTIFAGSPGQKGYKDGTGQSARFIDPAGLAVDSAGNIYVADQYTNTIRKITPDAVVTTLAGQPRPGSNDGVGKAAQFQYPGAVTVDPPGNVYVSDYGNATLRKITPSGSVTTLAGAPQQGGWVDAIGSTARLSSPFGITIDASGKLYFADVYNDTIRAATPATP